MVFFMARHKLTDAKIKALKKPGVFGDGEGLYLRIHPAGSKGWFFIYTRGGIRREIGLGGYDGAAPVSLALARRKADEQREILAAGQDPFAVRQQRKASTTIRFADLADEFIGKLADVSRHTRREWERQLLEDCSRMKSVAIKDITTEIIETTLLPIWKEKPATGQRIRSKLEAVLDYATAKRMRTGENPAKWGGHLEHVLSAAQRVTGAQHAALPYSDIPLLFVDLSDDDVVHQCLAFTILTAVRTTESRGARWEEVDWKAKNWTVPAERMKTKVEHVVPLSDPAVAILRRRWEMTKSEVVFEGTHKGKSIGNSAMRQELPNLRTGVTVHGFRSSFSDWSGEETSYPREITEWSLAHQVGSAVERAYRRGDALEKRRQLMAEWGAFCVSETKKKAA